MAGPSEKRSGTFSKRQVVKVFKYATSNLAGRRCRPGQARPGFHQATSLHYRGGTKAVPLVLSLSVPQ